MITINIPTIANDIDCVWHNEIDRTGWPAGPWDTEPDRAQWVDKVTCLPCLAVRSQLGHWCGYVGLRVGHPWRERDDLGCSSDSPDVHGGITYGPDASGDRICHETAEPDDVRWIGFDCVHAGDASPSPHMRLGGCYRTLAYVRSECADLARQVAAALTPGNSL